MENVMIARANATVKKIGVELIVLTGKWYARAAPMGRHVVAMVYAILRLVNASVTLTTAAWRAAESIFARKTVVVRRTVTATAQRVGANVVARGQGQIA